MEAGEKERLRYENILSSYRQELNLISNRANLFTAVNTILLAGFVGVPLKDPNLFIILGGFAVLLNIVWYALGIVQYNDHKYWYSALQEHELGIAYQEKNKKISRIISPNWILCKLLPALFIAVFVVLIFFRHAIFTR